MLKQRSGVSRFAYQTTGLAVKALSVISKAKIRTHGVENIPKQGSIIFVINHFTRIETVLVPYHIFKLTNTPVWSLASYELFRGALGSYLEKVGAVSTKDPDRDLLIVKSLLTGEASWVIFPEGRMVKNKKIIEKGRFMISYAGGKHPPHTGAATLALRTEFYRERLQKMLQDNPQEAEHLKNLFQLQDIDPVLSGNTYIVPVNISYYPVRARENALTDLAEWLVKEVPDRMMDEIMTEGTMLLSGVDVDIRFGKPIEIKTCLTCREIQNDLATTRRIEFDDVLPSRKEMRAQALHIMQAYMASIYSMTTVNHDHIFASIIRMMPYHSIPLEDFKLRGFLAASLIKEEPDIFYHESLDQDQVHLLTDDQYGKFKDFLGIAREREIIRIDGNRLIKDKKKFSSPYDFHRARIDNPVEVMANAVEPLTRLQRHIRKISWLPGFMVKPRVVKYLIKKAEKEFERDYKEFFVKDESKPKQVGRPYLIKKSSRIGVLLIHGYMAAPMEVRGLADYLGHRNITVYAPRVKGHGTSPDDLARRTHHDWLESVEAGYVILRNVCERVIVGGFSNGAGLALHLASRMEDLNGVFAVCPPLELQDFATKLIPAVHTWNRLMTRVHFNDAKKEFVDNNPENPHINYLRNPISGLSELERLMNSIEPKLSRIQIPALIVQASKDPVVNPRGSKKIYDLLGSRKKTYTLFNYGRHGILLGEDSEKVHRTIWEFIEHVA